MKLTLFCCLLVALSGCESAPAFQSTIADSHCTQTANQRASEAGYSGEDAGTQQAVFDKVYAECTLWQNKLKLTVPPDTAAKPEPTD